MATRRSGWSCRNINCLWSEVISHSTSSRLITVSASCRTCRGLHPTEVSYRRKLVIGRLPCRSSLSICTSSLDAEPVARVSTAPQPFWKEEAKKRATLGGMLHSSWSSSWSCAKSSSNKVTLKNTHKQATRQHVYCSFKNYTSHPRFICTNYSETVQ